MKAPRIPSEPVRLPQSAGWPGQSSGQDALGAHIGYKLHYEFLARRATPRCVLERFAHPIGASRSLRGKTDDVQAWSRPERVKASELPRLPAEHAVPSKERPGEVVGAPPGG